MPLKVGFESVNATWPPASISILSWQISFGQMYIKLTLNSRKKKTIKREERESKSILGEESRKGNIY